MNKLTLSCLKSLVQTRPKGDWDFLTRLVLVWPEARIYYWTKQGFRTLLQSWPFTNKNQEGYLWLPEDKVFHGIRMELGYYCFFVGFYDRGEPLMTMFHNQTPETCSLETQAALRVWVHTDTDDEDAVLLLMNLPGLALQYKEHPMLKQKVIRTLILARDLGKTDIKTLNTLAALTCKA